MTEASDWQRTSPFAAVFFFARIVKALVQNAWQSLAPLAAVLFASQGNVMDKIGVAAIAVIAGSVAVSLLQYWFFRFRITEDAVLIRQGVLQKKQLDIKFRRIQGINTSQNILYRPLGLVNVSFDTAGSSGSEGTLPAIRTDFAQSLERTIGRTETEQLSEPGQLPEPATALLTLDWRDMLRIGLSDRRALVVLALLGPLFEQLGDAGERMVADYATRAAESLERFDATTGVLIVVLLVLGAALVLALASIAAAFLRYHRFELSERGGRLQTVGGLLTRHTRAMELSKIQLVQLRQGALLRLFGRWHTLFRQAASGGRQSESKSIEVPIVTPEFVPGLARRAFSPELAGSDFDPRSDAFRGISPYYMRTRFVIYGLLLPLVVVTLLWQAGGMFHAWFLWFTLWPLLVAAMVFQVWRRYGVQFVDDGLVHRSGFIGYTLEACLFRKVQRVTVSQSPLQRRKGLAGMHIYLASGSIRIRYIDHHLACQLRDRMIYTAESSDRSWF